MLRIPYSSMFLSTTDILRTLANFNILPEWASFKYFREKVIGISSFDDFAKFSPLIYNNETTIKRLLASENKLNSTSKQDNNTVLGPNLSSIGIESSSILMNIGSLGDMVIGMLLFSLGI